MIGTVALLDAPDRSWIESLRTGTFFRPPAPHVSFHVAAAYDWAPVVAELDTIAIETAPFEVEATGADVFDVEDGAALYVQLARSERLIALQRRIFDAIDAHAHHTFEHYKPELWLPHVTIAQRAPMDEARAFAADINDEVRGRAVHLTNLAFLSVDYGRYIMSNRRDFSAAL